MAKGPEWPTKGQVIRQGMDKIGEDARMATLRKFFTASTELGEENPLVGKSFKGVDYARALFLFDVLAGGMKGPDDAPTQDVADEYLRRIEEDLSWFVENGILEETDNDEYFLTEKGREVVLPKH